MRHVLFGLVLSCASLFAQPDAVQTGTLSNLVLTSVPVWVASGSSNGVVAWRLTYSVDGTSITAASLAIQGTNAATQAACTAASSFSAVATGDSSLVEASNPSASAAQGNVGVKTYYPCVRVLVSSTTGSGGSIPYQLTGYRGLFAFSGAGSSGGQSSPDLVQTGALAGAGTASGPVWAASGSSNGIVAWRLTYSVDGTGITAASLAIQGTNAATAAACAAASSFTTITSADSSLVEASNPSASAPQGNVGVKTYFPCVRVLVNSATGSGGSVPYQLAGYRGVFTLGAVLPQCTATLITNCTPAVSAAGVYVPPLPTSGSLTYYFTNTASDIATYLAMTTGPFSPKTTLSTASLGSGTATLNNWATAAAAPGLTFIPAGPYTFHIHAAQTGGSRSMTLQCAFVEVNAAGTDIAVIGTSEASAALTGSETEYTLVFVDGNVYNLASSTSRIVARVQAVGAVTGSNATIALYYGDTADSHIALPTAGGGNTGGKLTATFLLCAGPCVANETSNWKWSAPFAVTATGCLIDAQTYPTGAAITVDVLKGGATTIFTSTVPTLANGSSSYNEQTGMAAAASLAKGDYLVGKILTVGSTIPGQFVNMVCTMTF